MRLGIDIDDVLYPWYDNAHAVCERAGVTNGVKPTRWDVHVDYGITRDEWHQAVESATILGLMYQGSPYAGVVASLRKLRAAGHSIHLVTARGWLPHGPTIKRHTVSWLEEWEVPYDSLTFTTSKAIIDADIFVDDSPVNHLALTSAGKVCVLVDQPWNADHPAGWRVRDFNEFAAIIAAESERLNHA